MTSAADLPAAGLGAMRRVGLLLLGAGVALLLVIAAHPSAGTHPLDDGPTLHLATATAPQLATLGR
jgi:hypothetical protein